MDSGLLLLRVTIGLLMAAHGSQKLFGWFGGYGLAGTTSSHRITASRCRCSTASSAPRWR